MWQKCPICNGTGIIISDLTQTPSKKCGTCNGKKIISSLTGKPPKEDSQKDTGKDKRVEDFFKEAEKFFGESDKMFNKMSKDASSLLDKAEDFFKK